MAILKVVQAPNGATGQYNKLIKAEIFADSMSVVITTNVYATEEARDAGLNILWVDRTSIPFSAFTQDPRNPFYNALMTYSYSPFKGGAADETPGDDSILLTPESTQDVNYGDSIRVDNGGGNINYLTFNYWDRKYITADGIDVSTIINLPNPTTFTIVKAPAAVGNIAPITETSGSFSFATTVPGEYSIRASAFGYYDNLITIIAYPVGTELPPEPVYPPTDQTNPPTDDETQIDNGAIDPDAPTDEGTP